jgi:hypothetical protein
MKRLIAALVTSIALVSAMTAPSFAQRGYGGHYNQSPSSGNYGGGGY